MARNNRTLTASPVISGIFGYVYADGSLEPVCAAVSRDEAGVLIASLNAVSTNRKGATIPGAIIPDVALTSPVFLTYGQVERAARKAMTPVILGRKATIAPTSRFGTELARLKTDTFDALVSAGWRVATFDAKREGFTLPALRKALRVFDAQ